MASAAGDKTKRQRIELPGGKNQDRRGDDHESGDKLARQLAGRQGADLGARVGRVDVGVDQPIERHGSRACGDQGDTDPQQHAHRRDALRGEHRSGEPEGEREEGVLPLDHLQRGADAAKKGHTPILIAGRWEFVISQQACAEYPAVVFSDVRTNLEFRKICRCLRLMR